MDNRAIREAKKPTKLSLILPVVMIVVGLISIYSATELKIRGEEINIYYASAKIILIVAGLIPLMTPRRTAYMSIGFYALGLGAGRAIRSIPQILSPSPVICFVGLILLVCGANLAYNGVNYMTIRSRAPVMMRYMTLILATVYLVLFFYELYMGISVQDIFMEDPDNIGYMVLYCTLLVVLFSKEVTDDMPLGRVDVKLTDICSNVHMGNTVSISAPDLAVLKDGLGGNEDWSRKTVCGETVGESCIQLQTAYGLRDVVVQKWSGRPGLFLSVVDDRRDSFISGKRFNVIRIDEGDGIVLLCCEDGTRLRLMKEGSA